MENVNSIIIINGEHGFKICYFQHEFCELFNFFPCYPLGMRDVSQRGIMKLPSNWQQVIEQNSVYLT